MNARTLPRNTGEAPSSKLGAFLYLYRRVHHPAGTGRWRAEDIDWKERTISFLSKSRVQTVPFGDMAATILESLPKKGWLFPGRDENKPYNGWAKGKRELHEKYAGKVAHYTLHDLRRT